jgi:hypothetical protein
VLKLVPASVLSDARRRATETLDADRPRSYTAAAIIVLIWLVVAGVGGFWVWKLWTEYDTGVMPEVATMYAATMSQIAQTVNR